jgi:calcium binding protein 39
MSKWVNRLESGLAEAISNPSDFSADNSSGTGRTVSDENDLCLALKDIKMLLYSTDREKPIVRSSSSSSDGDGSMINSLRNATVVEVDIVGALRTNDILVRLALNIEHLRLSAGNDVTNVFKVLMRRDLDGFAQYIINSHGTLPAFLLASYEKEDRSLNCGQMLRECIRYSPLMSTVLDSDLVWRFIDVHVHKPSFEISSDAFMTLRELLLTAPDGNLPSKFLETHFEDFFLKFEVMLLSENYVTRKRSLKLLGELLLKKANNVVMRRFIDTKHYLKVIMVLLRDKSVNIQYEAFHVFKIFAANPTKVSDIRNILLTNRDKLVIFLRLFKGGKLDDSTIRECDMVLNALQQLEKETHAVPKSTEVSNTSAATNTNSNPSLSDGAQVEVLS